MVSETWCKICLKDECSLQHSEDELSAAKQSAEKFRQDLRTIVELAKKLEE